MGRTVLIALLAVLAGCAPEPTSRELLLQGAQEIRVEQRRQRADIAKMQAQLREIDSLINVYNSQLP